MEKRMGSGVLQMAAEDGFHRILRGVEGCRISGHFLPGLSCTGGGPP